MKSSKLNKLPTVGGGTPPPPALPFCSITGVPVSFCERTSSWNGLIPKGRADGVPGDGQPDWALLWDPFLGTPPLER